MIDGKDFMFLEGFGERAHHDQAILQDVGDSAGSTDIVFENEEFAGGGVANEVDAADVSVNAVRDFEANHFAAEVTTGIDEWGGDFAVFDDELLTVDILQKKIQGNDALA
jgi:hypothetical protein